jgi:hypothetical protein
MHFLPRKCLCGWQSPGCLRPENGLTMTGLPGKRRYVQITSEEHGRGFTVEVW